MGGPEDLPQAMGRDLTVEELFAAHCDDGNEVLIPLEEIRIAFNIDQQEIEIDLLLHLADDVNRVVAEGTTPLDVNSKFHD